MPGVDAPRERRRTRRSSNPRDHRVEIQLQSKGDQLIERLRDKLGADTVPASTRSASSGSVRRPARSSATARGTRRHRDRLHHALPRVPLRPAVRAGRHRRLRPRRDGRHRRLRPLHKEITLSTIAAVLTIVGYSMNDTVVVYDRIRENLGKHRGKSFAQIINLSVSETLSRTILTSRRDDAQRRSRSSSGAPASSRTSRSRWSSASSPARTRASTSPRRSPSGSTSAWPGASNVKKRLNAPARAT